MSKKKKKNPYKIASDIGKYVKKAIPVAMTVVAAAGVKQGPKIIKKIITK